MTEVPDAVMLFAAGFGTRMRPLTDERPKPLIEVAGRPLIDHALDHVQAIAPSRVVANLHYLAPMLRAHLAPKGIALSDESPDILDTGGGLKAALPQLGNGPVFTMNTDAIWAGPNPLMLLRDVWDPDNMDALLMCIRPENALGHVGSGDFTPDSEGRITRGPGLIYGGIQIIKTGSLHQIDQMVFSLNLLWDRMIEKGRARALTYPGRWCDVGHPGGIGLAESLIGETDV